VRNFVRIVALAEKRFNRDRFTSEPGEPTIMTERLKSPPPNRDTKTPKLKTPPGATDTHFHLYGPGKRFPYHPDAPLLVEDSTLDDMLKLHNTLGIERGVIVHSVVQGNTYEYLLHALSREPERLRGIALPAPDITDRELEILTKAGVVAPASPFGPIRSSTPRSSPAPMNSAGTRNSGSAGPTRRRPGAISCSPHRVIS